MFVHLHTGIALVKSLHGAASGLYVDSERVSKGGFVASIDIAGFATAVGMLVLTGCVLVGGWVIGLGAWTAVQMVWRSKVDIGEEIEKEFMHRTGRL